MTVPPRFQWTVTGMREVPASDTGVMQYVRAIDAAPEPPVEPMRGTILAHAPGTCERCDALRRTAPAAPAPSMVWAHPAPDAAPPSAPSPSVTMTLKHDADGLPYATEAAPVTREEPTWGTRAWAVWKAEQDAAKPAPAAPIWPMDYAACPKCHGSFSFNSPGHDSKCPYCGYMPPATNAIFHIDLITLCALLTAADEIRRITDRKHDAWVAYDAARLKIHLP